MGRIIDSGKKGAVPQYKDLSKEYQELFNRERIYQNIKRERILSFVLSMFLSTIIGFILLLGNRGELDRYLSRSSLHIHITLLIISILFLLFTWDIDKISKEKIRTMYLIHCLIISAVMVFSALIAINNEIIDQRPFTYIVAIFSIAASLILDPLERHIALIASYCVYLCGVIYLWGFTLRILECFVFSFPLMTLALLVSSINYSAFVNSFVNNKLLKEKSYQLDNMYKTVEELLEQRTEQLKHAVELERTRTGFFSNISHELRTPLNLIYSAEQILQFVCREKNLELRREEITRYNDIVQQNCCRMIRLIENLIDITEIDAGEFRINLELHNIVTLVGDIVLSAAAYIKDRNIELDFSTEKQRIAVFCDREKIERVVLNLLSNAVKFTPAGGNIKISIYERYGKAVISVRDTGIGIPMDMKELVFDRFVQVDKSISRTREGSGIGLSIAKALVDLHKGSISVISEEGIGSEFIIELPADLSAIVRLKEEAYSLNSPCFEKIKIEFSDIYD